MLEKQNLRRGGFTLVEIMIVVAIIALLAAIAVPSFMRARKRSQAISVKEDLRLVDAAIDQYALENNKVPGDPVDAADVANFLKRGSRLEAAFSTGSPTDSLLNPLAIPVVDSLPQVPAATNTTLSDVVDPDFWAPFSVAS